MRVWVWAWMMATNRGSKKKEWENLWEIWGKVDKQGEKMERKRGGGQQRGKLCLWTFQGQLLSSLYRSTAEGLHVFQTPITPPVKHAERGPSPSLGSGSVDASRHQVSFTIASSRQEPCINHVQCDSPTPPLGSQHLKGPFSEAAQLTCTAVGGMGFKLSVHGQMKKIWAEM